MKTRLILLITLLSLIIGAFYACSAINAVPGRITESARAYISRKARDFVEVLPDQILEKLLKAYKETADVVEAFDAAGIDFYKIFVEKWITGDKYFKETFSKYWEGLDDQLIKLIKEVVAHILNLRIFGEIN